MTLGEQITTLRKRKGLSQAALGKLIGTSGDIIGRYERGVITPSIDVMIKMADALEVSLDYLTGKISMELDKSALERLEDIAKMPEDEQESIFKVVDALIRDYKSKTTYAA
jgi:transcriptional regulator with XRE-family HTH domain